jgi:K+-sensing histidine kinase KdpD
VPSLEPFWLLWKLPLLLSFSSESGETAEQDEEQRASACKKARVVLPLMTDAVGVVLARSLSHESLRETENRADREALREMELLKAELLASVSHELRSPLTAIKGYATTLLRHERRISREERHEFLLAINAASDRLAGVIDSLGCLPVQLSPLPHARRGTAPGRQSGTLKAVQH